MRAKLIASTKPDIPELKDLQHIITYCARVSNQKNQLNDDTRLLQYLMKHQHWSPFEMVNLVIEIETTRDISRQILRHRSFSFQEFSQRYAEADSVCVHREARMQDKKNRQNSLECTSNMIGRDFTAMQEYVWLKATDAYQDALRAGIAKEQARALLPEGLTMSRLYANGTLRSWLHYCQLRMGEETQKEHREIASECWSIVKSVLEVEL